VSILVNPLISEDHFYVKLLVRGGEVESEDSKPEYSYDGNGSDQEENYELFKNKISPKSKKDYTNLV
jgi:hypothetical protein